MKKNIENLLIILAHVFIGYLLFAFVVQSWDLNYKRISTLCGIYPPTD